MTVKNDVPEVFVINGFYKIRFKGVVYPITNFTMESVPYDGLDCYQFYLKNKYGHVEYTSFCAAETKDIWLFKQAVLSLGNFVFSSNQRDFEAMIRFSIQCKSNIK